jgi:putative transposase
MDPIDALESGQVKRFFRARQKLNAPGLVSHITQRASGVDSLFHEEDDYLEMLARLKQVSQTHEFECMAFVLMPNHVHLLLRQKEANLHEAMRDLFRGYSRRHNKKYERKGHLFGGRYRQAVCLDDAYLLAVSLYIHLNPVRAGLAQRPADYRWSSCRLFTQPNIAESFVSPDMILKLLSEDHLEAKQLYIDLLEEGRKLKMGEVIEDRRAIHDFQWKLSSVFHLFRQLAALRKGELPEEWDEKQVDSRIAALERGGISAAPQDEEARKYLVEQLLSRGYTRREIARKLGISRKTLYNLLSQPPK